MRVDVEAPQTSPLVLQGSSISEKGSPRHHRRPSLQSFLHTNNNDTHRVIRAEPRGARKTSCCCKCICRIICILFLLLVILGAVMGILFLVFRPKIPKYSVDSLKISDLRLNLDMSLYAQFNVKITANNPNKKIGIYYEKGGRLSVLYTKIELCSGSIPKFYQGHENITKLDVSLSGQAQYGNTIMKALQEQQQTGRIPLDLKIDAPVAVKLGKLKLKKIRILGDCLLIVDSLSANNLVSIKASNCKFRLKL
ncbi:Late embryogenesis abundant (LEA) hydroxyproline-rich glycoprotein family [Euphorbia peplus]|nr:Late embryogenesis abundant (LEA) hydroxyproline-rich glycoprotein family [Euphorbia peplus]